jgi:prepilin-type N-terminal cleavage/methylation domain-containing protein
MKTFTELAHNGRGFTLIEIIITLIVASFFSIFIIAFMGTNTERSAAPLLQSQDCHELIGALETITASYKRYLIENSNPLVYFHDHACDACVCDSCTAQWIQFNASNDETTCTPPGCKIVKVTVATGKQSLAALFTN